MLLFICVLALYSGKYRLVGCMIAVCLVHGGVKPQFFSRRLYNQVCGLPAPEANITVRVDYSFKDKLLRVSTFRVSQTTLYSFDLKSEVALFNTGIANFH